MRSEGFITTNLREYPIDSSLVLHQVLISLVFIMVDSPIMALTFFSTFHELFSTLAIFQLKAESGKGNFLCRPIHVESDNL
jgi:hypothetical protein